MSSTAIWAWSVCVLVAAWSWGNSASANTPALTPAAGGWVDPYAPARIRHHAEKIERLTNWPGLGDFLTAVAWTESSGRSDACNRREGCWSNAARGWFQLRPESARVGDLGLSPDALFDEPTSVALAAWYAHRLRDYAARGQTIDWLALRRGWAYPSSVADVHEARDRSRVTRERFEEGIRAAGLNPGFATMPAFSNQYDWPGIDAVLAAVQQ
jgi:hypothetical protein